MCKEIRIALVKTIFNFRKIKIIIRDINFINPRVLSSILHEVNCWLMFGNAARSMSVSDGPSQHTVISLSVFLSIMGMIIKTNSQEGSTAE